MNGMGMKSKQPERFDLFWRAALLGIATFVVSSMFFTVLFMVLLGNNNRAGVAALSAAFLCAVFEVWRVKRKWRRLQNADQQSETEQ